MFNNQTPTPRRYDAAVKFANQFHYAAGDSVISDPTDETFFQFTDTLGVMQSTTRSGASFITVVTTAEVIAQSRDLESYNEWCMTTDSGSYYQVGTTAIEAFTNDDQWNNLASNWDINNGCPAGTVFKFGDFIVHFS